MLKTAVAIRHIDFEDLGFFEAPLRRAGYDIRYHEARDGDPGAGAEDADLLIILGGPMGVYEEARYPFLSNEIAAIARRVAAKRPTLGICLGAQLIARAMGAAVYPGAAGKEIGFAPVALSDAGRAGPLGPLEAGRPVLHWHGDTFDLPPGAEWLASSEAYPNQAFADGPNILALQFHLEAGANIDDWLVGHAAELRDAGIDTAVLKEAAGRHAADLESVSAAVIESWLAGLRS